MPVSSEEPRDRPEIPGFRLLRELGRGGVGVVYEAEQLAPPRRVALKMLISRSHSSQLDLQRFQLEATTMLQLRHPNLTTVYLTGHHQGLPFLVMELLTGGTLTDQIRTKTFSIAEAVSLLAQLSEAVGYCHEQGFVHRDLKPANIMFTADGCPKVTDFGMAKQLEASGELTTSGTLLGTPNYMAPEQAQGDSKKVRASADVWSLGVILYETCTGKKPFAGSTLFETLHNVQNGRFEPPRSLRPDLPEPIERILLKCLQFSADRRYQSGTELAEDLRRWMQGEAIFAQPLSLASQSSGRNKNYVIALVLLSLGLLSASLLSLVLLQTWPTESTVSTVPTDTLASQSEPEPAPEPRRATSTSAGPSTAIPVTLTTPIRPPAPLEVAPPPLSLPPTPAAQAEYARSLWWEALFARPMSRKQRLVEAMQKGLQSARNSRDGQAARHSAWLGVVALTLADHDLAMVNKELATATQAPGADREPLVLLLRSLLDRARLVRTAQPSQPLNLTDDRTSQQNLVKALQQADELVRSRADRVEEAAVTRWFLLQELLNNAEAELAQVRKRRAILREAETLLQSLPRGSWPERETLRLGAELARLRGDFSGADQILRQLLTSIRDEPWLWLHRGRLLVQWGDEQYEPERQQLTEKALLQARTLLAPTEHAPRVQCLYWLARATRQKYLQRTANPVGMELDEAYLDSVQLYQEAMNQALSAVPVEVGWYQAAAQEMPELQLREARRLSGNPRVARPILAAIERMIRRPEVPLRPAQNGWWETEKVELERALGLMPRTASWASDVQNAIDLGLEPTNLAQDHRLQARLYQKLSRLFLDPVNYPNEYNPKQAILEAERAIALLDRADVHPAEELAVAYARLGELHYRVAEGATTTEAKQAARQLARKHLQKALERGVGFPQSALAKWMFAQIEIDDFLPEKGQPWDAVVLARVWCLHQEALQDATRQGLALEHPLRQAQTKWWNTQQPRVRKIWQEFTSNNDRDRLLVEVVRRELDRQTAATATNAKSQWSQLGPNWEKLINSGADDFVGDRLRAWLKRQTTGTGSLRGD